MGEDKKGKHAMGEETDERKTCNGEERDERKNV